MCQSDMTFSDQQAGASYFRHFAVEPNCADWHRDAVVWVLSQRRVHVHSLSTQVSYLQASFDNTLPTSLTYRVLTAAAES